MGWRWACGFLLLWSCVLARYRPPPIAPPPRSCAATSRPSSGAKYRVAMATIVNNEGRWIAEWILFHRLIGFDHFYVYDDKSTDDTVAVVRGFASVGLATLHTDVAGIQQQLGIVVPQHIRFTPQFVIVQHAARVHGAEADWLGFFDVDEFVLPNADDAWCITQFLGKASASQGVLRIQGKLMLPNVSRAEPLPRELMLLDEARTFTPLQRLENVDRVPLHKNFARPTSIANFDHKGIHHMKPREPFREHIVKPKEAYFLHFRFRTMHDFEAKQHKAYAGHRGKAEVWAGLKSRLGKYLMAKTAFKPRHPLLRLRPYVRPHYAAFYAWYARPAPRPALALPDGFGGANASSRGVHAKRRRRLHGP